MFSVETDHFVHKCCTLQVCVAKVLTVPCRFFSSSCDMMELRRRYQSLYIPSDFFDAVFTWVDAFPLTRPFQFSNACNFHILHKEVDPLVKNTAVLDPPDANHTYSAKVSLSMINTLRVCLSYLWRCCEQPEKSSHTMTHPTSKCQSCLKLQHSLIRRATGVFVYSAAAQTDSLCP